MATHSLQMAGIHADMLVVLILSSRRRHKMSHDPPPDVITEPVLSNTVPDPDVKNDEYD